MFSNFATVTSEKDTAAAVDSFYDSNGQPNLPDGDYYLNLNGSPVPFPFNPLRPLALHHTCVTEPFSSDSSSFPWRVHLVDLGYSIRDEKNFQSLIYMPFVNKLFTYGLFNYHAGINGTQPTDFDNDIVCIGHPNLRDAFGHTRWMAQECVRKVQEMHNTSKAKAASHSVSWVQIFFSKYQHPSLRRSQPEPVQLSRARLKDCRLLPLLNPHRLPRVWTCHIRRMTHILGRVMYPVTL
jgi:hypothetical protein